MREIREVLAELFVGETQSATTARLASGGMRDVYQGKVSRWLSHVEPSLEQLAEIERIYGRPRGWILWRSGFIDAATLATLAAEEDYEPGDVVPQAEVDQVAQLRAEVDGLRADIRELRDAVATRKVRRRPPEASE